MKNIGFILSTARTGTQFFESYINQTSQHSVCLHEPKPSRVFKLASNYHLQYGIKAKNVLKAFELSRTKYLKTFQDKEQYIESNNFVFGLMLPLARNYPNLRVLHIVRNPCAYIQSHLNHGFWVGIKKFIAKNVPFWLENLALDKEKANDPVYILAARWFYVNRQILEYQTHVNFRMVRFENLFSENKNLAVKELNQIRDFFELETIADSENLRFLAKPKNKSKKQEDKFRIQQKHIDFINAQDPELLEKLGYFPAKKS